MTSKRGYLGFWLLPRSLLVLWAATNLLVAPAQAAAGHFPAAALADLSLEELGNIRITSVSKRPEPLADAAASVYIITAEDIRRSGFRTLPDALRLAPNLHVAQDSAWEYYISARGFNGSPSIGPNKILALIDGRPIYSPLFSGVMWESQDVMLEDVERIEVISGPAGTLWGMNAMNGVINVITRSSGDTQGSLVSLNHGNRGSGLAFRHGGTLGEDGYFRLYGKTFDRKHTTGETGLPIDDDWYSSQVGFRADWHGTRNSVSLQGNAFRGSVEQQPPGIISSPNFAFALGDLPYSGVNLVGHWNRWLDGGSNLSLKAYYARFKQDYPPFFDQELDVAETEFQHTLPRLGRHAAVWGASYRYVWDRITNSPAIAFLPPHVDQKWVSVFAQDEITLPSDLRLTLGARMENHPYIGWEWLPNARLAWKPGANHLIWTAASRAARGPTRFDHDLYFPGRETPGDIPFGIMGGPNTRAEIAKVFEIGYRGQPTPALSYSVTAFHTVYDHLRTMVVAPDGQSAVMTNDMRGRATGIEMWGAWQIHARWRLSAGYTALREQFRLKAGGQNPDEPKATGGNNPAHTWQVRSTFLIADDRELSLGLRRVAGLPNQEVPSYTAIDARFAWRLRPNLELSVSGHNIFGTDHAEYEAPQFRGRIPTQVFAKLVWRH